ncbi:unnamed protein product [Lactuca virosa]|uniref:Uncharacterized protein n=1 Tax=Lactuca virosa TaxID=75947 RepID=A0AAU9MZ83_9ASTR|nr:unnamed protein product [Lactuca virosa]
MTYFSDENLLNATSWKKRSYVLDLNASPPRISYEKEDTLFSENTIPTISTICHHGLKANVNMVEEALANIPLSFKRQEETSESILVIEKVSIMHLH